jgi:excisionase family DNA binding protein
MHMSDTESAPGQPEDIRYDLKSAKEAAEYLRISEATIWRYVDQDLIPAYRLGPKRVWFKRSDLDRLLEPLKGTGARKERRVNKNYKAIATVPMEAGARGSWDAFDRAADLRERIMARRRGVVFSDSTEIINTARDARTAKQR